jgi:uncharacterized protein YegL
MAISEIKSLPMPEAGNIAATPFPDPGITTTKASTVESQREASQETSSNSWSDVASRHKAQIGATLIIVVSVLALLACIKVAMKRAAAYKPLDAVESNRCPDTPEPPKIKRDVDTARLSVTWSLPKVGPETGEILRYVFVEISELAWEGDHKSRSYHWYPVTDFNGRYIFKTSSHCDIFKMCSSHYAFPAARVTSAPVLVEDQALEKSYVARIAVVNADGRQSAWSKPSLSTTANEVFGDIHGNPVVLIIDESGSMKEAYGNGTRRSIARKELRNVLENLPEATKEFIVVPFSNGVGCYTSSPRESVKVNVDRAMKVVTDFPEGGTQTQLALRKAYDLIGDRAATARIYLLSDGVPSDGAESSIINNARQDIPIEATLIGVHNESARQFMKNLASKTGGEFRAI